MRMDSSLYFELGFTLDSAGRNDSRSGDVRAPGIGFRALVPKPDVQLRALADGSRRRSDGQGRHVERIGLAVIERVENRSVALQHERTGRLAERRHAFGVLVDAGGACPFEVAHDEHFIWRKYKCCDFSGTAHVRCLAECALVQNERIRAAVVEFHEGELRRILGVGLHEEFAHDDVVDRRCALDGRELERNLQIHVLRKVDRKRNFAAQRFNLEVWNGRVFVKREVVFQAEDGLVAFVLHRDGDVVFAVELEVVTGEGDVLGVEHHGVGEGFAIAGELHFALLDACGVPKADGNLHIDEPDKRMHRNLQVHGGTCFEGGRDFALLHQGPVRVELRVEHPFFAREKVEVERLLFDGVDEVERVRAVAVEHKAVEQRRFGKVQIESDVGRFASLDGRIGRFRAGFAGAIPERNRHEGGGCAKADVFFCCRTHITSYFVEWSYLFNTLLGGALSKTFL